MSSFRQITPEFWASAQLESEDFPRAAAEGCRLVINNRPDGEVPGQLPAAEAAAAAHAAGLAYLHLPIVPGGLTDGDIDAMSAALNDATGRVLAYCATGNRSTILWALAQVKRGAMTRQDAVRAAADGGYDVTGVLGRMKGPAG